MNRDPHPDDPHSPTPEPITTDRELAQLDKHMQALFLPTVAPADLESRTIAHISRSRFGTLKQAALSRGPLAIAATIALATTGYYAQGILDPQANGSQHAVSKLGSSVREIVNGRSNAPATAPQSAGEESERKNDGQNVYFADGHVDWPSESRWVGTDKDFDNRDGNAKTKSAPALFDGSIEGVTLGPKNEVGRSDLSATRDESSVRGLKEPATRTRESSVNGSVATPTPTTPAPAITAPTPFRPADRFAKPADEVAKEGKFRGGYLSDRDGDGLADGRFAQADEKKQNANRPDAGGGGGGGAGVAKGPQAPGQQQAGQGQQQQQNQPPQQPEQTTQVVRPQAHAKVIRSGRVEFEVDSFDSSLMTITKLVMEDGGFVASTDSSKLPNGKTRGMIVVRVPPDRLDAFLLKLRGLGDLKSQQIAAQDVGKQYTDIESQLKAARAMEERLLEMIAKGQGAIKDLLAAEKELGTWREKIEKFEGEKRYFDNLISMSTLQLTLQERDIKAAAGAIEQEQVNAGVETDDVLATRTQLLKAIDDAKGRVISSDLNQLQGGQLAANVTADVSADQAGPLVDRLRQLGRVARLEVDRKQTTVDGSGPPTPGAQVEKKPTRLVIALYNLTNVAPRTSVTLNLASPDVEQSYRAALDRINKAGGRIVGSSLARPGDLNVSATINFDVTSAEADNVAADLRALGEVTRLQQQDNPDLQNTTLAKRGFVVQIVSLAVVQPRQSFALQIATSNVSATYQKLLAAAQKSAVRITQSTMQENDRDNQQARLDVEIPAASINEWEQLLAGSGDVLTRNAGRTGDGENVVDAKTRYTLQFLPADRLPPRKMTTASIETSGGDVETASGNAQLLAEQLGGRVVDSSVTAAPDGKRSARTVIDVPLAKQGEVLNQLRAVGDTRSLSTGQNASAPDGAFGRARFDVTFTAGEALVAADDGFWASIVRGFATSLRGLALSLQWIVVGLCLIGPWVLLIWLAAKIIRRRRANTEAAAV